jgi:hypothetical protein
MCDDFEEQMDISYTTNTPIKSGAILYSTTDTKLTKILNGHDNISQTTTTKTANFMFSQGNIFQQQQQINTATTISASLSPTNETIYKHATNSKMNVISPNRSNLVNTITQMNEMDKTRSDRDVHLQKNGWEKNITLPVRDNGLTNNDIEDWNGHEVPIKPRERVSHNNHLTSSENKIKKTSPTTINKVSSITKEELKKIVHEETRGKLNEKNNTKDDDNTENEEFPEPPADQLFNNESESLYLSPEKDVDAMVPTKDANNIKQAEKSVVNNFIKEQIMSKDSSNQSQDPNDPFRTPPSNDSNFS